MQTKTIAENEGGVNELKLVTVSIDQKKVGGFHIEQLLLMLVIVFGAVFKEMKRL